MQAASKALDTAWTKITAAQKANEYALGGHGEKAKDAIKLAIDELKLAAEESNEKKK
jgi:phage-related minor tail protein